MYDAAHSPVVKPQTDVLRALAEGAVYVKAQVGTQATDQPVPKVLYIATDGLSNTGCADLRGAAIGDLSAIPAMVTACKPELPELDTSYTINFIGIGNAGDGWPDIKTPQRTWLVSLWKALCEATKATCTEPASAKPASAVATGMELLADADVLMPQISIKPGNPTVLSIPAPLLFDVDSYQLANGRAQDALADAVKFLRTVAYSRVVVAGHTDSTGTPEHNRTLSEQRANAVADALRAQQITNISAAGHASSQPACSPEYTNGQPDREKMACNRRVEIIVYT
ncbi:OmpA family protein [Dactylosporangium sp. NPDC051541]|uniref:OmpA family protein n=1 Tax=Dactylosporangium sp. NPDC051541 TaxID=3363977 RepID=UPI003798C682